MAINLSPSPGAPLAPGAPSPLPVEVAAAYCRRYTNHVMVTGGLEELTLSFGQLCPERPQGPTIEMYASLSLTRGFAQEVVNLLQQHLRQPPPIPGR